MLGETSKQSATIGASHDVFNMVLGMRHHAEHVALLTDDACNRCRRAIDIVGVTDLAVRRAVTIEHAPVPFEATDSLFVRGVISFAMRHRHADHLPRVVAACKRRIGPLDAKVYVTANELE